jgi:hypothetical protein
MRPCKRSHFLKNWPEKINLTFRKNIKVRINITVYGTGMYKQETLIFKNQAYPKSRFKASVTAFLHQSAWLPPL